MPITAPASTTSLTEPSTNENNSSNSDTLVIELLTNKKTGFNEIAEKEVKKILHELAEVTGITPVRSARTHISPKYGFSGWLPGENIDNDAAAIHAYIWDDRAPSFASFDIATAKNTLEKNKPAILEYLKETLSPHELVVKNRNDNNDWKELDSDIYRQRLYIKAKIAGALNKSEIFDTFYDLCELQKMARLTHPLIEEKNDKLHIWEHWETSGLVSNINKENGETEIDIYTCKAFDPKNTINFIKERLGEIETTLNF